PDGIILAISSYFIFNGEMSVLGLVAYFLLGNLSGNLIAYLIGSRGQEWLAKFDISVKNEKVDRLFARYGAGALLVTQIFSRVLRVPVIYAAGIQRMNLALYLTLCAIGNLVWGLAWILLGLYISANWDYLAMVVDKYKSVQLIIGGILVIILIYFYRTRLDNKET
ncbi:MAG: DedA family protein, partial [Bacillota bacterium]